MGIAYSIHKLRKWETNFKNTNDIFIGKLKMEIFDETDNQFKSQMNLFLDDMICAYKDISNIYKGINTMEVKKRPNWIAESKEFDKLPRIYVNIVNNIMAYYRKAFIKLKWITKVFIY